MNNSEIFLLSSAIAILLGLITYSAYLTYKSSKLKSGVSQSESLKKMLDEYAKKVQTVTPTIDEKFDLENIEIPTKQYKEYDNSRAVDEMGLTKEDADAFVHELVKAIESEIPRIEAAILSTDYKAIQEIVHTITGSSSTLGCGGISSALISFYTSVQHHDSYQQFYIHLQNVKYYLEALKKQYKIV